MMFPPVPLPTMHRAWVGDAAAAPASSHSRFGLLSLQRRERSCRSRLALLTAASSPGAGAAPPLGGIGLGGGGSAAAAAGISLGLSAHRAGALSFPPFPRLGDAFGARPHAQTVAVQLDSSAIMQAGGSGDGEAEAEEEEEQQDGSAYADDGQHNPEEELLDGEHEAQYAEGEGEEEQEEEEQYMDAEGDMEAQDEEDEAEEEEEWVSDSALDGMDPAEMSEEQQIRFLERQHHLHLEHVAEVSMRAASTPAAPVASTPVSGSIAAAFAVAATPASVAMNQSAESDFFASPAASVAASEAASSLVTPPTRGVRAAILSGAAAVSASVSASVAAAAARARAADSTPATAASSRTAPGGVGGTGARRTLQLDSSVDDDDGDDGRAPRRGGLLGLTRGAGPAFDDSMELDTPPRLLAQGQLAASFASASFTSPPPSFAPMHQTAPASASAAQQPAPSSSGSSGHLSDADLAALGMSRAEVEAMLSEQALAMEQVEQAQAHRQLPFTPAR
jgi:hypothetical protein